MLDFEGGNIIKYIPTKDLIPGMVLNREIVTENGVILLEKGVQLTAAQVENLNNWDVPFVGINDGTGFSEDTVPVSKESFTKKYEQVVNTIRTTFETASHFKQIPIMEIRNIVDEMINPLVSTVGALDYLYEMRQHSDNTFQHSVNVAVVTGIFGKWLNFDSVEHENLVLAGLLHDIGKLSVPLSILHKPDKLSDIEFSIIKKHPEEGFSYVKDLDDLTESTKKGILQHHERIDGSGYPLGIKYGEIHEHARVVAVADIYDAMTSDRSYRPRLTPFAAMESISEQIHDKLDTGICLPLLNNMRDHFMGSNVLLSNGECAKIIVLPHKAWTKPMVRTNDGTLLDLRKEKISIVDLVNSKPHCKTSATKFG